jgi:hypothetical protein
MLRRLFGTRGPVERDPEIVIPGAKQGGHGDHWGCILRTVDEGNLIEYLVTVTQQDDHPENFGTTRKGLVFRSEPAPLRTCVTVMNGVLASAYPEVQNGPVWPILVQEIIPWANGIEGQISGSVNGAIVRFFDTRFYANAQTYRPGETYNFHMGALAYTVGHAPETEAESSIGATVSFKGASAYMPASSGTSHDEAEIDDYWFHSPLQSEPAETTLAGQHLTSYPIIMAIPNDYEMHLHLYAADHVLASDMALARPEDDLQGFLWLQGHLATETET